MALDFEDATRRELRRACWVEWVAHYTYGQTRDRVAHAEARVTELEANPLPARVVDK